ncbi:MAG: hypothetical protein KUG77_20730, partial [Nannocystaceae bacterium]|nr:hypothetical protein [Nannocystaceae bacterium]
AAWKLRAVGSGGSAVVKDMAGVAGPGAGSGTIASRIRRARGRVRALIEQLTEDKDLAAASLHGLESRMRSIRGHMDTTLRNRVSAATER